MSNVFYTYNPDTKDEKKRKKNIEKFLEGLLDQETATPEVGQINPTSSQNVPIKEEDKTPSKKRYLAVIPKKKDVKISTTFEYKEKWNKPHIPGYFLNCPPELANLPTNELYAFRLYPTLLITEKENISKIPFSIHNIKHNNSLVQIYTGLPVALAFFKLASMFKKKDIKYYKGWIVGQLTIKQQLLMTIMKLKLALTDVHLSMRFRCSLESVTNTIYTWLFLIHYNLYGPLVSRLNRLRRPNRMEILFRFKMFHTISVYSEVPQNLHVPHRCPLEPYNAVVSFRPDGLITFSSELYTWNGQVEDIIQDSKILETLVAGDVVYHDKSMQLRGLVPEGVTLLPAGSQVTKALIETRDDLQARLMEFNILKCIPTSLWDNANTVWQVVVILSNFGQFRPYYQAED